MTRGATNKKHNAILEPKERTETVAGTNEGWDGRMDGWMGSTKIRPQELESRDDSRLVARSFRFFVAICEGMRETVARVRGSKQARN